MSLYKPVYKNLILIKKLLLIWYFFGWFPFETKAKKKSFLCFHCDVYFKISLVLPLGFKVINMKNCIQKILNVNLILFHSLTSGIADFPISSFIFVLSYLCKKKLNLMSLFFLLSSLLGKIQLLNPKVLNPVPLVHSLDPCL